MSNVIHFGRRRQEAIGEEACLWVVKLERELSAEELEALHAWLDTSPDRVKALLKAAQAWDHADLLSELAEVFPLSSFLPQNKPERQHHGYWKALLAAAALAVFCLTSALWSLLSDLRDTTPAPLTLSYQTRIGQQSSAVLPDGSSVTLNTNSLIEVEYSDNARNVYLRRGEAHFEVAKDPARPFRVHAEGGVVEAVGTAFTVQESGADGLQVTVVEGVVNFTPLLAPPPVQLPDESVAEATPEPTQISKAPVDLTPIALSAGESVQVKREDEAIVKQKFRPEELETRLAWREGMLLFQGDPLEKVVRELSRYTSIRIDVDDAVRDIEVLGYFRTGDIEGVLLTMRETFHIKVERLSADHIVLKAEN